MAEALLIDVIRTSHHRQHHDQVVKSGILFKHAIQSFDIPGASLGVSPRNVTCVLRRKMCVLICIGFSDDAQIKQTWKSGVGHQNVTRGG